MVKSFARRVLLYGAFSILIGSGLGAQEPRRFDVLITGAQIIDGTGNPWFPGDIGITDGRIAALGMLDGARASRSIDMTGRFVSPGFIDIHSHSEDGLADPNLRFNHNMIAQGITLSVVNQDGRSPLWPIRDQKALYERQGVGNNVALMVGHGTIRTSVMRERHHQPATESDIRGMRQMVREGMVDGAFGLSTGLAYLPMRSSEPREVIELAGEVKPFGGFYISHQRSDARLPTWKTASDPTPSVDLLEAVEETIAIGRQTGVPVVATHIKARSTGYWGTSHAVTRRVREARGRGIEAYLDQYPYDTSGSDGRAVLIPRWALAPPGTHVGGQLGESDGGNEVYGDLKENLQTRLTDSGVAARVRTDIEYEISRRGGASGIVVFEFPEARFEGRTLASIAAELEVTAVDAVIWLQMNGFDRPGGCRLRGFSLSEADIEHFMQQEFTATSTDGGTVALGEGLPHARFYGTFPRKIRRYVRERGTISLPFAIRSMTSLPAQIMGLKDRGVIRVGAWADLVVFDLETIADRATFLDPHQYPAGVPYVFVNGVVVVDAGEFTDATPGKVLSPSNDGWRVGKR